MDDYVKFRLGPSRAAHAGYRDFQRRLTALMVERRGGAPVTVVAEEANVNPATWKRAEDGKLDVHVSTLFKICAMLNTSPSQLFSE